ncbi:MAG TPA: NUDIX domain-containing protein [Chloroflexota bacterium]
MSEITRHFTATTFVVRRGKVLLHLHPKQRLWLPPGGHIERDELPHDAARREIEEETGLRLRLHSEQEAADLSARMACDVVPQPAFILIEDINPYHQHIDFTYFALVDESTPNLDGDILRQNGFQWFSPDELTMEGVPQNVREGARRAITYFDRAR